MIRTDTSGRVSDSAPMTTVINSPPYTPSLGIDRHCRTTERINRQNFSRAGSGPTHMAPRTSRKPTPHLPQGFVEALCEECDMEGNESAVFTEAFHRRRLRIVDQTDYATSPDDFVDAGILYGESSSSGVQRNALHHAAVNADPIAVCELIRLRATIDYKDSMGDTPLALAVDEYCAIYRDARDNGSPADASLPQHLRDLLVRLEIIIRILVEQHADVNFTKDGNTYLHQLCAIGDWDLIELFLQHGATSPNRKGRRPVDLLSENDRDRYRELIRKYPSGQPRPLRLCPCFSGKPQEECHKSGKSVPFPPHFYCICGSKRSNANCACTRQDMAVVEIWDDTLGVIRSLYARDLEQERISRIMVEKQNLLDEQSTAVSAHGRSKRKKVDEEKTRRTTVKYVEELADRGVVDPAFAFALKHVGDLPRPGKKSDPRVAEIMQYEWNAYVDEYIESGTDLRPQFEIERAAKIALNGGALYRQCEGPGCEKWEGHDLDTLRACSRCKVATYCSAECQRAAWKDHKLVCNTANQSLVKTLPSQTKLGSTVLSDLGDLVSTLKTKLQELQGSKGKEKGKERSFAEFYE